jgi:predicted GIY-YIG superfamily endonuclease
MTRYSDLTRPPHQTSNTPRLQMRWRHLRRVLYLVELDQSVATDPVFQRANPGYVPGSPCYYAGSTSQTPEDRYREHSSGGRNASRIAHRFGKNLRMDLVPSAGKRYPRERALKEEIRLARALRAKGFGVWQA